jgi:hypothetical protein
VVAETSQPLQRVHRLEVAPEEGVHPGAVGARPSRRRGTRASGARGDCARGRRPRPRDAASARERSARPRGWRSLDASSRRAWPRAPARWRGTRPALPAAAPGRASSAACRSIPADSAWSARSRNGTRRGIGAGCYPNAFSA